VRLAVLALVLTSLGYGQTALPGNQIKVAPTAPSSWGTCSLIGQSTSGTFVTIKVGPGVTCAADSSGVLTISATPAAVKLSLVRLVKAGATWTGAAGAVMLVRNGLVQWPLLDYTLAAGVVTPLTPWADDDIVTALVMQ
jgi:hypothetical protein